LLPHEIRNRDFFSHNILWILNIVIWKNTIETSINYSNIKPSLHLPTSSNTEDEAETVSETFYTHYTLKGLIPWEKLITLKADVRASNSTGGDNESENTVKHTQHIFRSIKHQKSNNVILITLLQASLILTDLFPWKDIWHNRILK
jgi:hypothetical protein